MRFWTTTIAGAPSRPGRQADNGPYTSEVVIPAEAGIRNSKERLANQARGIPAFAGMTAQGASSLEARYSVASFAFLSDMYLSCQAFSSSLFPVLR